MLFLFLFCLLFSFNWVSVEFQLSFVGCRVPFFVGIFLWFINCLVVFVFWFCVFLFVLDSTIPFVAFWHVESLRFLEQFVFFTSIWIDGGLKCKLSTKWICACLCHLHWSAMPKNLMKMVCVLNVVWNLYILLDPPTTRSVTPHQNHKFECENHTCTANMFKSVNEIFSNTWDILKGSNQWNESSSEVILWNENWKCARKSNRMVNHFLWKKNPQKKIKKKM